LEASVVNLSERHFELLGVRLGFEHAGLKKHHRKTFDASNFNNQEMQDGNYFLPLDDQHLELERMPLLADNQLHFHEFEHY
jgi:hypothetical protein